MITAASLTAVTTAGAVFGFASGSSATTATPDQIKAATAVATRQLDDLQRRNPGARRISALSLEIAPGAVITMAPTGAPPGCNYGDLCVYSNARQLPLPQGGWYLHFTNCGEEWNLGNLDYPEGGKWNDKISAIYNHQTPNTTSYFYNYRGYGGIWDRVLTVYAGDYRLNLADDGVNDIIDGIHVCGSVPNPWQPNRP